MKNLPKAITFQQFPSITASDDDVEEDEDDNSRHCGQYLRKFATMSDANKTFRLWDKDGKFYIGNKLAKIKENNIIVGDKEYAGISGPWELIMARSPDDKIFTNADYYHYAEIMHSTNYLRRNNDECETKPKANKWWNWKHILKPIWDEKDVYRKRHNTFGSNHHFTM